MPTLDRDSPLPLYYQLKQIIIEKLESGAWKPGDLVPSEQELQNTYGLSRITVRQALTELTYEGHFERHRGQGTFVANKLLIHNPSKRVSITELMRQQGITPDWQIRQRGFVSPSANIQERLQVQASASVYTVEFLLAANQEPIGWHLTYLPSPIAAAEKVETLTDEALGEFFRTLPNRPELEVRRTIQAVPAGTTEAKRLNIRTGHPILSIEVTYSDASGQPIEHLHANYRGDRFKFELDF